MPKEEYAGGVIYECGGTEAFMYPTRNAGTSRASQAYWQVDDVEAEVAELKARGVVFEEHDLPGAPIPPTPVLVDQFFNDSTGQGADGEIDVRGTPSSGCGDQGFLTRPTRFSRSWKRGSECTATNTGSTAR